MSELDESDAEALAAILEESDSSDEFVFADTRSESEYDTEPYREYDTGSDVPHDHSRDYDTELSEDAGQSRSFTEPSFADPGAAYPVDHRRESASAPPITPEPLVGWSEDEDAPRSVDMRSLVRLVQGVFFPRNPRAKNKRVRSHSRHVSTSSFVSGVSSLSSHSGSSVESISSHIQMLASRAYSQQEATRFRVREVPGVSTQLRSASLKAELGLPYAFDVFGATVAFGMSHGVVAMFGGDDRIFSLLGASLGGKYGPCTAVSFHSSGNLLVSGYRSGYVILWDTAAGGKRVKVLPQQHNEPVVHLFLLADERILSCDAKGTVLVHEVSRKLLLKSVGTNVVLDGSAGPVYALSPLPVPDDAGRPHFFASLSLVALCTTKRLHLISFSEGVTVLLRSPRPKGVDASSLPCLAWTVRERGLAAALLTVCWGTTITVLRVRAQLPRDAWEAERPPTDVKSLCDVSVVARMRSVFPVVAAAWAGSALCVASLSENQTFIQVVDPSTGTVHESEGRARVLPQPSLKVSLFCHTRWQDTDGVRVPAYNTSLLAAGARVMIMSPDAFLEATVLTWRETLSSLASAGEWSSALALAMEFQSGRAHSAVGLPAHPGTLKAATTSALTDLLVGYTQTVLSSAIRGQELRGKRAGSALKKEAQATREVCLMCAIVFEYATRAGLTELLFDSIFPLFRATPLEHVFLETLEPFILAGRLTTLPPEVVQMFVRYYETRGVSWVRRVERCLLLLDLAHLDFHQVVKLCRTHKLFVALTHLYTVALHDFLTPLTAMLSTLEANSPQEPSSREVSSTLFLFMNVTFSGKRFPSAVEPLESADATVVQVVEYLLAERAGNVCSPLEWLVSRFPDETLNSMSVLFDLTTDKSSAERVTAIQMVASRLSGLAVSVQSSSSAGPSQTVRSALQVFLVKQHLNDIIYLPPVIVAHLMPSLAQPGDLHSARARESALLALMERYPEAVEAQAEQLLLLARSSEFWRVSERLYSRAGNVEEALHCRIRDSELRASVFSFIGKQLADESQAPEAQKRMRTAVATCIRDLLELDAVETSKLVLQYLVGEHETVLSSLDSVPRLQLAYLRALLDLNELDSSLVDPRGLSGAPAPPLDRVIVTPAMHEQFFALLCEYEPGSTLSYLQTHDTFPLASCLRIALKFGHIPASAFLYERTGDVSRALDLLLQAVVSALGELRASYIRDDSTPPDVPKSAAAAESAVISGLENAIALCQRTADSLSAEESERMWFRILDAITTPLRLSKDRTSSRSLEAADRLNYQSALLRILKVLLHEMMGHIRLRAILAKVFTVRWTRRGAFPVTGQDHGNATLGEFKGVITGMVETAEYEEDMLEVRLMHPPRQVQTATHLLKDDYFRSLRALRRGCAKALPSSPVRAC